MCMCVSEERALLRSSRERERERERPECSTILEIFQEYLHLKLCYDPLLQTKRKKKKYLKK